MCVVGLWSTTHTSGGGGWATTAAAGLFTCRGSLPATPLRSQIIVTLLKSHCVPVLPGRRLPHSCVTAPCISTGWLLV